MQSETSSRRQHKGKMAAPIDTSTLRHSTRNNKYDGFRVVHTTDTRSNKSKVKPHIVPSAAVGLNFIMEGQQSEDQEETVPPPTTISTMQAIGTQLCAIPADELTVAELVKEPEDPSALT